MPDFHSAAKRARARPPAPPASPMIAAAGAFARACDRLTSSKPDAVRIIANTAVALSRSPMKIQAKTNAKSGLLTWNALALAGPSRVIDSRMNQRPRYVENPPATTKSKKA